MLKKLLIVFFFIGVLLACSHHEKKSTQMNIVTVTSDTVSTPLYYAGIIQPLKSMVITSPSEGVIEDTYFHYGDFVKKGQLLFSINSEKFQTDYKAALMQYIKSKNEFNTNKSQLSEGVFLHKNQLISDDDFKMRQTNFYNAQLSLLQAKDVLSRLLKQLNIKEYNLYSLKISDIDKITNALHMQSNSEKLQLFSPADGVALLSVKSDNSSDKKFEKGEAVKQGDVLALIGDAHGFSVRISVNEFDINQLKVGQAVKVTGAAFPDFTLKGFVSSVDHQAQVNQNGIPNFSAEVQVSNLTSQQLAVIHIGMSAKVEINIQEASQIMVPLAGVTEKNGIAYVQLQDSQGKKVRDIEVKTGKTTADSIVILSNLKVGDKIVVPN